MVEDKKQPAANGLETFETPDLDIVIYLTICGIRPSSRTEENGIASLTYNRTVELNEFLLAYMNRCESCGISFSRLGAARAEARKMLIDGKLE